MEFSFVVVTEYTHGRTLEHLLESPSELGFPELMSLYAQLGGGALLWLKGHKIIHRNIRSAVILVPERDMMSPRLTGFSECFSGESAQGLPDGEQDPWILDGKDYRAPEMQERQNYSFPVDMYSLSKIIKRAIEGSSAWHGRDSYLRELVSHGLHASPGSRITPSDLRTKFEQMIGCLNSAWPPFQTFGAERKFTLNFKSTDDGIFVLRSSLRAVVTALWGVEQLKASSSDLKWAYSGPLEWIKSREAAKHCFSCKLDELGNLLLEASAESNVADEYFSLCFQVNFSVYYHAPSLMTNVRPILLVAGINSMPTNENHMYDQLLTVFGPWQGDYLGYSHFQQFSANMERLYDMKIPSVFRKVDNPQLERRFSEVDGSEYAILAVNQLYPHMVLVRKRDRAIHWMQLVGQPADLEHSNSDENFVGYLEACWRCFDDKMQSSLTILAYLCQEQPLPPFADIECEDHDEVFTSILTSQSFEKKEAFYKGDKGMQFRFKKKAKSNETPNDLKRRIMDWSESLPHDPEGSPNHIIEPSTTR